jgi:hypothetical protein
MCYVQYPLFTILVMDGHGNGVPVAWYYTARETASRGICIQRFLEASLAAGRKLKPDFAFGCVICDNSAAEQLTIRQVKYFVDGA